MNFSFGLNTSSVPFFFILFYPFTFLGYITYGRKISYIPVISGYPKVPRGNYSATFFLAFFASRMPRDCRHGRDRTFLWKSCCRVLLELASDRVASPPWAIPLSRFAIYKSSGKWRHTAYKSSFQSNFQAMANDSSV